MLRTMRASLASLAGIAMLATIATPASAAPTEFAVLQKIPKTVLDRLAFDAKPDAAGAMQLNVGAWHGVVYQRVAIPLVWTGAVEEDQKKIDDGWRAIDLAFSHQLGDGSFATFDGSPMPPTDMSFWLDAVCNALLVVRGSSLAGHYESRIATLEPKIAKAAAWLEGDDVRAKLLHGDYLNDKFFASNRLLIDASAFITVSRLLHDDRAATYARAFLAQAVSRQTADGTFPENGGFDSSYQSVSLLQATYYAVRDPDAPGLHDALVRGTRRETGSVDTNSGELDVSRNTRTNGQERVGTHVKMPDYRSVVLGLYLAGAYLDDASATQAAGAVFKRTFHLDPNG